MSYGYDLCVPGGGGSGYGGWFVELHSGASTIDTPDFLRKFDTDARLIAAAPDLLEALKLAREYMLLSFGSSYEGGSPYARIDAAIAKAEGRS